MFFQNAEMSTYVTASPYAWYANGELDYTAGGANFTVKIAVDQSLGSLAAVWETKAESIWNYQAVLVRKDGQGAPVPIFVDPEFSVAQWDDPGFDQYVDVVDGYGRANMLTLYTRSDPVGIIFAHEFGHMMGAKDTYREWGVYEPEILESGTLMSDLTPVVRLYYFDTIKKSVEQNSDEAFNVVAPTKGTDGAESFVGGSGQEAIFAFGGDDTLFGNDGHDYLNGGIGNDTLKGGRGDDTVVGGPGQDQFLFDVRKLKKLTDTKFDKLNGFDTVLFEEGDTIVFDVQVGSTVAKGLVKKIKYDGDALKVKGQEIVDLPDQLSITKGDDLFFV